MLAHYFPGWHFDAALVAQLRNIACLTLVLAGELDGAVPADTGRLLKANLPHSYLVYVHDAAHTLEGARRRRAQQQRHQQQRRASHRRRPRVRTRPS